MARAPQARAPVASAEDDFYGEEDQGYEGAGGGGQEGQDGAGDPEDASLDLGTEQETGDGEDLDEDPDETPIRTRGESRQQRLANENARLRSELDEIRRAPRQDTQAPTGPRPETQQEFEARIALLPPDERMEQRHIRWEQRQEQQALENQRLQNQRAFQDAVARDKANYEIEAKSDQRMARFADRVEEEFEKRIRAGQPVSRKDLFYWLVGQNVAGVNGKGLQRQRDAARQRVDRQTVRPARAGGGSDVPAQRRGALTPAQARAKRLEGQQI